MYPIYLLVISISDWFRRLLDKVTQWYGTLQASTAQCMSFTQAVFYHMTHKLQGNLDLFYSSHRTQRSQWPVSCKAFWLSQSPWRSETVHDRSSDKKPSFPLPALGIKPSSSWVGALPLQHPPPQPTPLSTSIRTVYTPPHKARGAISLLLS